jgi:hypothetical protein
MKWLDRAEAACGHGSPAGGAMTEHRSFGGVEWDELFERWTGRAQLDVFPDYARLADFCADESAGRAGSRPPQKIFECEFKLMLIGPTKAKNPSGRREEAFRSFVAQSGADR